VSDCGRVVLVVSFLVVVDFCSSLVFGFVVCCVCLFGFELLGFWFVLSL